MQSCSYLCNRAAVGCAITQQLAVQSCSYLWNWVIALITNYRRDCAGVVDAIVRVVVDESALGVVDVMVRVAVNTVALIAIGTIGLMLQAHVACCKRVTLQTDACCEQETHASYNLTLLVAIGCSQIQSVIASDK